MFHGLVIVGHVAFGLAVIVSLAHGQRVESQMAGDTVHDLFNGHHPLWPTKATVGGVRCGVGLATMAVDGRVAQVIGVVGMEHGAVNNRVGQVWRIATVARQVQLDPLQSALIIKADVIFDVKRMTLAGHHHVFHTRQAHFCRLASQPCHHCAQASRASGLCLLTAKASAHSTHVDDDFVH